MQLAMKTFAVDEKSVSAYIVGRKDIHALKRVLTDSLSTTSCLATKSNRNR